ncbi:hypothetical protein RDI58_022633 [Solanum bulbocastanum]|uniref:Uncharacterized protein n=1 Tax=Solanum bulbocastanum TaxID=147425 RepID=A0AAN8T305_SOLBU
MDDLKETLQILIAQHRSIMDHMTAQDKRAGTQAGPKGAAQPNEPNSKSTSDLEGGQTLRVTLNCLISPAQHRNLFRIGSGCRISQNDGTTDPQEHILSFITIIKGNNFSKAEIILSKHMLELGRCSPEEQTSLKSSRLTPSYSRTSLQASREKGSCCRWFKMIGMQRLLQRV